MTALAPPPPAVAAHPPRPRRARAPRALPRPAAAVAAGAGLLLATPPFGLWPLAPLAVALLALAVHRQPVRRAYALGLLAGAAYLVPLLSWTRAPGVDAWLALAALETVLFALTAAGLALTSRLPAAPLWGTGVWVAGEHLRDTWPLGGLPWARLAFTQAGTPYGRLAALGGAPLVTAAVALSGLLLAAAVTRPRTHAGAAPPAHAARRARTAAIRVVGAVAVGAAGLAVALPAATATGPHLQVAVVQGDVPRPALAPLPQQQQVLANHVQQTLTLAAAVRTGTAPRPDLVLWPEDADDLDPFADRTVADELTVAAAAVDAPVLVGAVLDGPRPHTALNTGLLWTPTGYGGQQYVKQHPVPFGEYLPFRAALGPLLTRTRTELPDDLLRGTRPGVLTAAGARVGDVICFEVADDGIVRRTVDAGAQVLVVQTNDATFGRSGETAQQLAMARLRAVEHGRTVLVAATTGTSAVIAPDGRVLARSGLFTPATLSADVPLRTGRTVADRVGEWPARVLLVLGLVGLAWAVARRWTSLGRARTERA